MNKFLRILLSALLLTSLQNLIYAQTKSLPEIFEENFKKATLEVKLEVIKDGVELKVEGIDNLFSTALRYCVDNYKYESKNATFKEMMQLSINQVRERNYKPATSNLVDLFQLELDTIFKVDILDALTKIAPGDTLVVKAMNRFLSLQNESYRSAKTFDQQLVSECIGDLGIMGDASSFPPILIAIILKYSDEISRIAEYAIGKLPGDPEIAYMNFILEEQFPDKLAALKRAIGEAKLSVESRCIITEFALNVSIHTAVISADHKPFADELRSTSLSYLALNHWSHAADILIENFNIAVSDYDKNLTSKTIMIKAIDALGNMRSHQAAKRLVLYLEFINSFTERGKAYDEEIVRHVIDALKQLGDLVAQQALLYTRYLDYSDAIRQRAFDAYQALK